MHALIFFITLVSAAASKSRCGFKSSGTLELPDRLEAMSIQTPTIPVYFHVIHNTVGRVTLDRIKKQIKVLNTDYSSTGISFSLESVSYHLNPQWFSARSAQIDDKFNEMYKLRVGNASALNIYTIHSVDSTLGYSSEPWRYNSSAQMDSVIVDHSTLPGGNDPDYSLGRTLTHEIGHWLGLLHTFEGGCSLKGDSVNDTRPQRAPRYICTPENAKIQTCSLTDFPLNDRKQAAIVLNQVPNDPVYNFLGYQPDRCMNSFTPLQIKRMRKFWNYRLRFNY